jgi:hypothetical protein
MTTTKKLTSKQLLETIKDTIYEVLEEEIDRLLKEKADKKKALQHGTKVPGTRARRRPRGKKNPQTLRVEAIQAKKKKLLEALGRLRRLEKKETSPKV